ncbi:MAG: ring-cleaving dioxygenase [marine benthic group bacterium]|jgi:glyoxalase family protein|nr:ring-cleaving dioxygenase [Candidatus Carthagonibacter metallireducens]MCL7981061.1 ring-cleaving dioxygenase [Gemmatimonadota bacterium]
MLRTDGIHHVTSISGGAQRNVDFYVGTLGLRLVKRTVNFDDPGTWHLYYGDRTGSPGTLITFFPWEGAHAGVSGAGEVAATAYSAPAARVMEWAESQGLESQLQERFGQQVLAFRDTDGSWLELVGSALEGTPDSESPGVTGFHGVTLSVRDPGATARLLTEVFGFETVGETDGRVRFGVQGEAPGRVVDLVEPESATPARLGSGSVHHVAFRARDDDHQQEFREALLSRGFNVTPVQDRQYFRSIYFREPGGVLFEIATDPPGMLIDETVESLGSELRLPPWYESARGRIVEALTPIATPNATPVG